MTPYFYAIYINSTGIPGNLSNTTTKNELAQLKERSTLIGCDKMDSGKSPAIDSLGLTKGLMVQTPVKRAV